MTYNGDDLGRWLKRQREASNWTQLSAEQQERLTKLGVKPAERPATAPAAKGTGKTAGKATAAFQRGPAALAQYITREGHHRVPRNHTEELTLEGEEAPVTVKLGVWISNTKQRRDKLTQQQRAALRELGVEWA